MAVLRETIGCRRLCYAIKTQDDATGKAYGSVYRFPPTLQKIDVNPNGSLSSVSGDNAPRIIAEGIGDIDVSVDIAAIPAEDIARLLGHAYVNGGIDRKAGDASPEVALGFITTKNGGGEVYTWLYSGVFTKGSEGAETQKGAPNLQVGKLVGKFAATMCDNRWRYDYFTYLPHTTTLTEDAFFSAVYTPGNDVTPLTVDIAASGHTIVATFSKGSGANVGALANEATPAKFLGVFTESGAAVGGAWAFSDSGANRVATFTPSAAGAASVVAVVFGAKDGAGIEASARAEAVAYTA
jgi:phi13 family phage major tail protein